MAHLQWSISEYGHNIAPEPWQPVDLLLPAFRVEDNDLESPARARAALLSQEYPPVDSGAGKLYVGDCQSCLQWAGQNVGYIVNCADVSYDWHPFCIRFWLNIGYGGWFEQGTWQERMLTAVKLVLAALMFGENVLLHCRQGKHRSGAFCCLMMALLMGSSMSSAVDFYFSKRPDLHQHDRRIVDKIVHKKGLEWLLEKIRQQSWCEKALGNVLNRLWAHRVQNVPMPKRMPTSARSAASSVQQPLLAPTAKPMPKRVVLVPPLPKRVELVPPRRAALGPQHSASSVAPRMRTPSRSPRRSTSSSAAWMTLRVCGTCGRMPWLCKCFPQRRAQLLGSFQRSRSTTSTHSEAEVDVEVFEAMSRHAGVWENAEQAEHAASRLRDLSRSPSPEPHDKEAWRCVQCSNLNSKHVLTCTVATCGARRPLVQEWHEGDYFCPSCGNHRFATSEYCQWVHCHTNDWKCPQCQNVNYAARKQCHTRSCRHPRDWKCPRCGCVNWVVRNVCKHCQLPNP